MYGTSEEVIGHCLARIDNSRLFAATKVWTPLQMFGPGQMEDSRAYWGVERFDLMQVHNLLNWEGHLETLREDKAAGRIRYIGMTTSHGRRHEELERVMAEQRLDAVQLTYNILDREAEQRLLPLAAERGVAVIVNRPFRRNAAVLAVRAASAAGIGGGDRLRQLGAVPPQVRRLAPGGDLRDPGDLARRPHAGEHGCAVRPAARCGAARAHDPLRREPLSGAPFPMLPFTADILFSSIAQYNRALWPLPPVALLLGLAAVLLTVRPVRDGNRLISAYPGGRLAVDRHRLSSAAFGAARLRRPALWRPLRAGGAAAAVDRDPGQTRLPLPRRADRLGRPRARDAGAGVAAGRSAGGPELAGGTGGRAGAGADHGADHGHAAARRRPDAAAARAHPAAVEPDRRRHRLASCGFRRTSFCRWWDWAARTAPVEESTLCRGPVARTRSHEQEPMGATRSGNRRRA